MPSVNKTRGKQTTDVWTSSETYKRSSNDPLEIGIDLARKEFNKKELEAFDEQRS